MTQPQDPASGKNKRLSDQLEFWTETMYDFDKDIESYLRNDIGCKQLINAGNWKTADPVLLNDCERYSYTANEVTAVNRYVTDAHLGQNNGWAIQPGDRFQDRSVLVRPGALAVSLKQVAGCPMLITESSWVPPLSHQSEGPFLVSAYQSLNGVDAYYWFAFGSMAANRPQWPGATGQWVPPGSANGFLSDSLQKWVADTPEILGNFPAAALLFRKGYVQQGKPAVQEFRSLQDMWDRKAPIIAEEGGFDPNRDQGNYAIESKIKYDVDRLAFLVGPVEVTYNADPARNAVVDLSGYVDKAAGLVRSDTGQLAWDYRVGLCTLDAPKAKGATGFLGRAGNVDLDGVSLASGNDYATVLIVSMDDKPLDSSGEVLVQCGTTCRPTGWQQAPVTWNDQQAGPQQGYQIVNVGRAPWQVMANSLVVSIKNPSVSTATVLDMNGMPRGQVKLQRGGEAATFTMPADAMYVVLQ